MSHADAPSILPLARRRWLQHLPYHSLALFLAAIAALVWLTREYDDDAQRATLISDVLWMEQNLRFNLDRNYTAFGRVISGMPYVDAIRRGEPPVVPSRIVQASILADNKPVPPVLSEALLPAPVATDLNAPLAPATPTPPGN